MNRPIRQVSVLLTFMADSYWDSLAYAYVKTEVLFPLETC